MRSQKAPPKRIDPTGRQLLRSAHRRADGLVPKRRGQGLRFQDEGFHPLTGEQLAPVTREVVEDWKREMASKSEARCYVVTGDAVQYGDKPGIDPVTGKECREITPGLLERLREYEKGRRPNRITSSEVTFFDPRTGAPIVWYSAWKSGEIELFDLMGFHRRQVTSFCRSPRLSLSNTVCSSESLPQRIGVPRKRLIQRNSPFSIQLPVRQGHGIGKSERRFRVL